MSARRPISVQGKKLYFAYGTNLHRGQMARRCPEALPLVTGVVSGWTRQYHRVMTIEQAPGETVTGALWLLGAEDERRMDRCERYPSLYRKTIVRVEVPGGDGIIPTRVRAFTYVLSNGAPPEVPTLGYLNTCLEGARDWNIPLGEILDPVYRLQGMDPPTDDWYTRMVGSSARLASVAPLTPLPGTDRDAGAHPRRTDPIAPYTGGNLGRRVLLD